MTSREASSQFRVGILAAWLAIVGGAFAANGAPARHITVPHLSRPPKLEDFLDMNPKENGMARVEGFVQRFPDDGKPARQRTAVYFGYDDKNFYAVFVCYDTEPGTVRARMVKREDIFSDDFVGLVLDTFHDARRGYIFLTNPFGIQADGLVAEGQNDDYSFDTLWYSEGKRTAQGYVVWMAIPFKSLRFPNDPKQIWGIAVGRASPYHNEVSWWPYITERTQGFLPQLATMDGLENISPGRNLQFIPYGFFRSFRALDTTNTPPQSVSDRGQPRIGLDSKAVLKDKLVLDFTVNPDFSQVESDEPQVTVNQRFEVFFPEKRPFFLENSTFFQTPMNLLFTRRIADPKYGARLTGKLGRYALGTFLVDDQAPGKRVPTTDPLFGKDAFFGILRVNRDVSRESTFGLIATAREFRGSYNRLLGPDARWKLNPNWSLVAQAVTSQTRLRDGGYLAGPAYRLELNRGGRSFNYALRYNDVSPGFRAEAGFIPRVDIRDINQFVDCRYWPERRKILSLSPRLQLERLWNHDGIRQDWVVQPGFDLELRRQTGFFVGYRAKRERFQEIDFGKGTVVGEIAVFAFKKASIRSGFEHGTEINFSPANGLLPFLANQTNVNSGMTLQPFNALRIDNSYILSRLTDRATGASIFNNHIARMKINYQFTRRLSVRSIFQYETTLSNPSLTTLPTSKRFTGDFLLTYLVNPGTVLYVGYNDLLENLDPRLMTVGGELLRTRSSLQQTGKQFFVKFSHLFRF